MRSVEAAQRMQRGVPGDRYRLSARARSVLVALSAGLTGAIGAAAPMALWCHAQTAELGSRVAQLSQDNAVLRQRITTASTLPAELVSARQDLAQLAQHVQQLADANLHALHLTAAMPALKTPAYKEPFDRIVVALQAAKAHELREGGATRADRAAVQPTAQRPEP